MNVSRDSVMFRLLSGAVPGHPGNEWINRDPPFGPGQEIPNGPWPDVGNAARGVGSGFPPMETPIIVFDRGVATRQPVDVEAAKSRDCWLVSGRAKRVLESVDAGAFAFVEAKTRFREAGHDLDGPVYWLCDVVRFVDAIDETKTRMTIDRYANNVKRISGMKIDSEVFIAEAVAKNHVFRSMHSPSTIYCTMRTKTAIEDAGLKGFQFDPGGRIDG